MALIKIRSNPYTREIEYYEAERPMEEANPNSQLCEIDKKTYFLPFHAKEIIDIIRRDYYTVDPVEVVFEGTEEEYCELQKICGSEEFADKIVLHKGQTALENARSILKETKELFKVVQPIIDKILQEDSEFRHDIKLISTALEDIIPICVFGNVSSGKSTFINALIGSEIMPSGGDPVTAKIYEIKRAEREDFAQIRFEYHDDPVTFTFDGGKYFVDGADSDLVQKLNADLTSLNSNKLIVVIKRALEIINAHEKVDKDQIDIGSIIKVQVPFTGHGLLGQSKNKFVIFDTPGSNSATNKDHSMVLEEALAGFSNGIPLWVSTYDSLDTIDNAKLCKDLLELKALDNRFTMIVVNRADIASLPRDGFSAKQIQEILEYDAVGKMDASGLFFVSSIMGLGAKRDGDFVSEDYEEVYLDQYAKYSNPSHRFYKRLYGYNIMPEQIKAALCAESTDHENLVYANSGLYGVERQIETFGVKYSAYNKCQMVYVFLCDAITKTTQIIDADKKVLKELKTVHEGELAEQERRLLAEIGDIVAEREAAFAAETTASIMEFAREQLNYSYNREDMEELDRKIAEKQAEVTDLTDQKENAEKAEATVWRRFSENLREVVPSKDVTVKGTVSELFHGLANSKAAKKEWDEAQRELDSQTSDLVISYVAEDYRKNLMEAKLRIGLSTEHSWKCCAEQLKKLLIEKVTASSDLTNAQRERLAGIIVDFQPPAFSDDANDVFIKAKFLRSNLFGVQTSERLNIRRLAARYNEQLSTNIAAMAQMINNSRWEAFKVWIASLVAAIGSNIRELNPELRAKADLIKKEENKIAEYEKDQSIMNEALVSIREMMEWNTIGTEGV